MGDDPADMVAPAGRGGDRGGQGCRGCQDGEQGLPPGAAGGDDSEQGQEGSHGEVLHDQYGQHRRGLAVAQAAQVAQEAGDDAGGRDVGGARQGQNPGGVQAEQPRRDGTGSGVEEEVDAGGGAVVPEAGGEFRDGEVQAEDQQQKDDTDGGAGVDELPGSRNGSQPPVAESQSGQQIQRYGREGEAPGDRTEHAQRGQDGPQLQQEGDGCVHRISLGRCAGRRRCPRGCR